ncbi:MAG: alpha/beta hydrolase [Crenarchaeota archaeon]|nr:alpha/beta hydrolase [Thermoproteota archaeon]
MVTSPLLLSDGRQIGYEIEGNPDAENIIYFHGTASSRLEILLLKEFAQTYNFRLIGIDRPGYGLSTYKKRTILTDFISDINTIADHLELERFAILSWSGGGPFALSYLSLYPQRVTQAVIVGSPALPFDPAMAHNNNPLAKAAMNFPPLAKFGLNMFRKSVLDAGQNIEAYLNSRSGKRMLAGWSKPDAEFFSNPNWLKLMYTAVAEGFRQKFDGVNTVYNEHMMFLKPYTDSISKVPPEKIIFWQGAQDKTCPTSNGEKNAQTIKGSKIEIFPDHGHCVMFTQYKKLAQLLK